MWILNMFKFVCAEEQTADQDAIEDGTFQPDSPKKLRLVSIFSHFCLSIEFLWYTLFL